MGLFEKIISVKQALAAITSAFITILAMRVTWPMFDTILNLWTETTAMYVFGVLSMWLVITFILYVAVYTAFLQKRDSAALESTR